MTIIDNGIYFRPEGPNLMIGRADPNTPASFDTTADARYYEEQINYYMQERIPGMERCRLMSMCGRAVRHERCRSQRRLRRGIRMSPACSSRPDFGHGAMESPAVGLALCELLQYGEYRTARLHAAVDFAISGRTSRFTRRS